MTFPSREDALAEPAIEDGMVPVIWTTAHFNWHEELILRMLAHPGVLRPCF